MTTKRICVGLVSLLVAITAAVGVNVAPAQATLNYHYAGGRQTGIVADGLQANLSVHAPVVASGDFHSLAELSVQTTDALNTVEVGWTVDRTGVNGADLTNPHLFAGAWRAGTFLGYNAAGGFVDYVASALNAGDSLTSWVGLEKRFGIQYSGGNWWVNASDLATTQWIGYFPGTIWSGSGITFTKSNINSGFGEVAANVAAPTTDMGSGVLAAVGPPAAGAVVGSYSLINPTPAGTLPVLTTFLNPSNPTKYNVAKLSDRTIRYGGPGN